MTHLRFLPALLFATPMVPAIAQTPPADAPAPTTRAERDAANPLRMIIEAGKLKARPKSGEAEVAPRKPAERSFARSAGRLIEAEPPRAGPAAPTTSAAAEVTPVSSDPVASLPVASPPEAPPAIAAEADAVVAVAVPALPPRVVAEPAKAAALEPPELIDFVEPVIPGRLRSQLSGAPRVVIDLSVGVDGSVTDARVRSSSNHSLEPVALEAVRQWRYKPGGQPRNVGVELVFKL